MTHPARGVLELDLRLAKQRPVSIAELARETKLENLERAW
jgi:hypothetical protein